MNKQRREKIVHIMSFIEQFKGQLEDILDEEQDYYGNIPDNLLSCDRAEDSEEAIGVLEDTIDMLDTIIEDLGAI